MNDVKEQTGMDQPKGKVTPPAAGSSFSTSPSKRKRSDSEHTEAPQNRIRLKTDHAFIYNSEGETGNESPRTQISTNLSRLRLQADGSLSYESIPGSGESTGELFGMVPIESYYPQDASKVDAAPDATQSEKLASAESSETKSRSEAGPGLASPSSSFCPSTPNILPVVSPINAQVISPLASEPAAPRLFSGQAAGDGTKAATARSSALSSDSPRTKPARGDLSKVLRNPSPSANRISKPRKKRKSPPPSAMINDLVWSDIEITGHNPDDPNDDGYGINGIGFKPTPAMAEQRRMQRRRQIAEWKRREDVERRAGRRKARSGDAQAGSSSEATPAGKRVHFVENKALGTST